MRRCLMTWRGRRKQGDDVVGEEEAGRRLSIPGLPSRVTRSKWMPSLLSATPKVASQHWPVVADHHRIILPRFSLHTALGLHHVPVSASDYRGGGVVEVVVVEVVAVEVVEVLWWQEQWRQC